MFDILPSASPKDSFTNDFMVRSLLTILTVKLLLIGLFIFSSADLMKSNMHCTCTEVFSALKWAVNEV